jgi:arabinogalactan oligomer/maltooligosaccharide transport system permease protein
MHALSFDIMLQSLKQVGTAVIAILVFTIILELGLYLIFVRTLKHKYALPIMLLTPAAIGLFLLVIYPIGYELSLAISNMSLDNFKKSYNITDQTLTTLQEHGVPPETLSKLQGLSDQEYPSEDELLSGLEAIIGSEAVTQYKEQFLKQAQKKVSDDQQTTSFKITKRTLFNLKKDIPETIVKQLEEYKGMLNQIYPSEKKFLNDLEQTLGKEQFAQYKSAFLTYAIANPGPKFGIAQGIANFKAIFTEPVLKQVHFFPVLWRTILWTGIQVPIHVILGLGLAMLMNRPMKFRGLYRTLIVVPWAMPQVIAVLVWRGEFHSQYGFLNIMLRSVGLPGIEWKTDPFWNFVAMHITNIWLGVPFMMVILLGGLQSISQTFYEAADVDGASAWHKFRNITLPLLQPVMTPAIILGVIWTFNNFNVPFLINQNEIESSDILVTALFRAAFEYNRYGFASAFAVVIFVILLAFCLIYMRFVKLDLGLTAEKKKKA